MPSAHAIQAVALNPRDLLQNPPDLPLNPQDLVKIRELSVKSAGFSAKSAGFGAIRAIQGLPLAHAFRAAAQKHRVLVDFALNPRIQCLPRIQGLPLAHAFRAAALKHRVLLDFALNPRESVPSAEFMDFRLRMHSGPSR